MHFLAGKTGQQVGLFTDQSSHNSTQRLWLVKGICIREEQQVTLCLLSQLDTCPVLAQSAFGRRAANQNLQFWLCAGNLLKDRAGCVAGLIIQARTSKEG